MVPEKETGILSAEAAGIVWQGGKLRTHLLDNMTYFRTEMSKAGFELRGAGHPIVPVMFGDAVKAVKAAELLLEKGIYVTAFSYPVVPQGEARIRVQLSAAHTREELEQAVQAFIATKKELGI